ncbi:hypothetical protein ANCDUO_14817 [Ancylostoma duodenale]|uniref:Uncharacterized protein n=1 Tax=Ancylostoma duodenale TaxID=51022 RepID=A0A0C2G827_9BILA|nr:hypothetical protein ANCDUO_14817 [Ancylostoma duodenale]
MISAFDARAHASEAYIKDPMMAGHEDQVNMSSDNPRMETAATKRHLRHWRRIVPGNMRQYRSYWSWCRRQHQLGHEHRLVRTANNSKRAFATEM